MFLLHIPCWLRFLMWGVSITHPVLVSFLIGGVLLHIPCCLHFYLESFSCKHIRCWLHFYLWGFSYTSHVGFMFYRGSCVGHIFIGGVSLTYFVLSSFFIFLIFLFLSREFLLHIPCWVHFYRGSFSHRSHADFTFLWGVSLKHPMLAFLFCFLIWGVFLTHRVLASFLFGEFLLHISCWLHFYVGSFSYTLLKI